MLVFFDTEFSNFTECELISVGFVSVDGHHEFYCELTDYHFGACSDFVRAEVLPHLEQQHTQCDKNLLNNRLLTWFKILPNITIACDSLFDLKLLQSIFSGDMPTNITQFYDMRTMMEKPSFNETVHAYHAIPGQPWHHALHDARALRLGWIAWNRQ